jgi:glycerol-3-phosphate acyltransferase PlsY
MAGRYFRGIDLRECGSGSTGATNTLRLLGTVPAIVVLILDFLKGFGTIYIAHRLVDSPLIVVLSGIAVVVGHNWPLFFGFRGGRGIIPSVGVLTGLAPNVILIAVVVGVLVVIITRFVSLGSIIGSSLVPILMLAFHKPPEYVFVGFAIAALALWRHRPNIKRLLSGTESKIGSKKFSGDKG